VLSNLDIPRLRRRAVANWILHVAEKCPKHIPYGVTLPREECFGDDGQWLLGRHGPGLTCATFVVAVLRRAGLAFIDLATWTSRPDDREWALQIAQELRECGEHEQADFIQQKEAPACVRVRPMEVAGAARVPFAGWPVSQAQAESRGIEVLKALSIP